MEEQFLELIGQYSIVDYTYIWLIVGLILGFSISLFYDVILSFINYILNKAWLKKDYEEIIYYLSSGDCSNIAEYFHTNPEKRLVYYEAISNYEKRLKTRERRLKIKKVFGDK